jgi:hypothetical protein
LARRVALLRCIRYDAGRLSMRRKRIAISEMRFRTGRFLKRQFTRWRGVAVLCIFIEGTP